MSHASNTFKAKSEIHTAYASKFKDYWVLHGYIPTPFDPISKPRLLLQHINKLHVEKSWNMKNYMATDNGEMLVPALQSGDAIAVCGFSVGNRRIHINGKDKRMELGAGKYFWKKVGHSRKNGSTKCQWQTPYNMNASDDRHHKWHIKG